MAKKENTQKKEAKKQETAFEEEKDEEEFEIEDGDEDGDEDSDEFDDEDDSENEADRFINEDDLKMDGEAVQGQFENEEDEDEEDGQNGASPKLLEIDQNRLAVLKKSIDGGSLASIRMAVKLFAFIFNDKKLIANSVIYNVSHPKLLNSLMQIFFVDCPKKLLALPKSEKNDIVLRTFTKNLYAYIAKVDNESVLSFAFKSLADYYPLFLAFKTLNKKLIKTTLEAWGKYETFSVKFHSYLVIKEMVSHNDNEMKAFALKNFFQAFLSYADSSSWRGYNNYIFMKNCVVDLMGVELDISYVILFDKIKEYAAKIYEISKKKVF